DLRHITPDDVYLLRELTEKKKVEFNIEGNPYSESNKYYPGFQEIIRITKPDQCTLVPDSLEQITSDHGWDFINRDNSEDADLVNHLKENSDRVSFFVDPIAEQLEGAREAGTDRIEFYTGPYAEDPGLNSIDPFIRGYHLARNLELGVNAGHDLDLDNLAFFLENVPADEVSIGHALISDSLVMGIEKTVKQYLDLCN
ncbi:MAG: pyridoxine 5'-phosphate synthase, partial [SAR86 cluster bacterium]|nr:pyridoxine 5'-phosphate synthase [SAR86 cluster bacterium]